MPKQKKNKKLEPTQTLLEILYNLSLVERKKVVACQEPEIGLWMKDPDVIGDSTLFRIWRDIHSKEPDDRRQGYDKLMLYLKELRGRFDWLLREHHHQIMKWWYRKEKLLPVRKAIECRYGLLHSDSPALIFPTSKFEDITLYQGAMVILAYLFSLLPSPTETA